MGTGGEIKILFRRRGTSIAASMRKITEKGPAVVASLLKEVSDCFREIRCFLGADDHLLGIGGQGTQLVNNKGDDGP